MGTTELSFDPFIFVKEFSQPAAKFDPHRLPLMSSVWPSVFIACCYLLILAVGPRLMEGRKPFNLKKFLTVYNFLQVLACIYFIRNVFNTGYKWDYIWKCYMPGFNNMSHEKLLYFAYLLKLIELCETICFVLRKKDTQMSFLHVYHHVSTFIFTYFGVTLVGTGMMLTPYTLNMFVHAIMYSYYLASIYVKDFDKIIAVKKAITTIQMIQFTLILLNSFRAYYTRCGVNFTMLYFFIPNIILIFYEFYKFYMKTYIDTPTKKVSQNGKAA